MGIAVVTDTPLGFIGLALVGCRLFGGFLLFDALLDHRGVLASRSD
jgi:hypothetical protein